MRYRHVKLISIALILMFAFNFPIAAANQFPEHNGLTLHYPIDISYDQAYLSEDSSEILFPIPYFRDVFAVLSGTIIDVSGDSTSGYTLSLQDEEYGIIITYSNLSRVDIAKGEIVKAGKSIAGISNPILSLKLNWEDIDVNSLFPVLND